MEQPYLICGLGRIGWRVLEYLCKAGYPVVAVDTNCLPGDPRLNGALLAQGDCRKEEVLLKAGLMDAKGVLIMTNSEIINISTMLLVRRLNPSVRIVMRLYNENLILRLGSAVSNVIALSTAKLTAPLFALTALTGQALGTFRLEGVKDNLRQVAELIITGSSALRGKTIAEASAHWGFLVVAHLPRGGEGKVLQEVDPQNRLLPGDKLIVCAEPRDLAPLLTGKTDLGNVKWANFLRRNGRVLWRTLAEVELAVKLCGGIFLLVVLISTIFFRVNVPHDNTVAKAFFRTISLMATSAHMHEEEVKEQHLQYYVGGLRIVGALLTAAFTAIVTNYLVRARLGGAFEVRHIPDSGHIILVGLGNIGACVVDELCRLKERVVVIERDKDCRFLSSTRRQGVAVLVGDAAISQILTQAHVQEAQAVIVSTTDDLVNLEIALLVRELNPELRIVVHQSEPALAETLRDAANIRLALSIPTLVAPAFVAALFGDRVRSVFLVHNRRVAAVDLLIPPRDACLDGHSVRSVAIDYRLLPVAVFDTDGNELPGCQDVILKAGYRLLALSTLSDLERLLRREPARREYLVEIADVGDENRETVAALIADAPQAEVNDTSELASAHRVRLALPLTRGDAEEFMERAKQKRVHAEVRKQSPPPD